MGGLSGSAAAEIAAPLRTVFSAVADIAGYVAWHPGLDAATVLELDRWGRQSIVRIELTRGGRQLSSELRFSYESDRRVSWVQESGDARRFDGNWTLERARRGVVLATYSVELDLGRVAGLMLNGRLGTSLRDRFIEPMPARLQQHVHSLA